MHRLRSFAWLPHVQEDIWPLYKWPGFWREKPQVVQRVPKKDSAPWTGCMARIRTDTESLVSERWAYVTMFLLLLKTTKKEGRGYVYCMN